MMTELNSVCNRKLQSNFTESGVVAARFERIFSASSLVSYIQMLIKLSHTHAWAELLLVRRTAIIYGLESLCSHLWSMILGDWHPQWTDSV